MDVPERICSTRGMLENVYNSSLGDAPASVYSVLWLRKSTVYHRIGHQCERYLYPTRKLYNFSKLFTRSLLMAQ